MPQHNLGVCYSLVLCKISLWTIAVICSHQLRLASISMERRQLCNLLQTNSIVLSTGLQDLGRTTVTRYAIVTKAHARPISQHQSQQPNTHESYDELITKRDTVRWSHYTQYKPLVISSVNGAKRWIFTLLREFPSPQRGNYQRSVSTVTH